MYYIIIGKKSIPIFNFVLDLEWNNALHFGLRKILCDFRSHHKRLPIPGLHYFWHNFLQFGAGKEKHYVVNISVLNFEILVVITLYMFSEVKV